MFSQHDASVKQDDPAVPICQLVQGKIREIIVGLLHKFQFAQASVAHGMQLFCLLDHVRSVEVNEAEGNNLSGMLFCGFGNNLAISKGSEQTGC